jgi:hypothetical protein
MPDLFDLPPAAKEPTPGDCWLTPRPIIEALGPFDLDPCAPAWQPWPTAAKTYTEADNGLLNRWFGRVWLNPPYSRRLLSAFLARLVGHGRGTALIPAATDTEAFHRLVWQRASSVLFLFGRQAFCRADGSSSHRERANHASVLVAYGPRDTERLAFCGLPGKFWPLEIPRGVLVMAIGETWAQVIAHHMQKTQGPVRLDDLYRALADHPKAKGKRWWREKIRQQLQAGQFERVGPGEWRTRLK